MVKKTLPQPFFFERGPKAVLLMHAYTGTPNDVRMMGRALEKENYTVYAPLFKGHGTLDPEDILAASPTDWIQDAKEALQFLAEKGYQQVAVFGLSLGGIIATKMMVDENILASGTFCSPVIRYEQNNVRSTFLKYVELVKKHAGQSADEINARMPLVENGLDKQLKGISEIVLSMEPAYKTLTKPMFIAQAGKDELIDPQIAVQFKEALVQAEVDFHWYENSKHAITVGVDHKELEKDVLNFLSDLNWNGE
ncbi:MULTISPECIES: alpha/beta hydrolase [Carnobacterium]|uniref:Alpha/beta hydrolase n=1 Tax=Carnobacterium antarcticum TaxID=2126436 RepID=A0ABW4NNE7_9LACT|nr:MULTISPECIES: alpha/beta fold hydrolase [unclassified Carnobacterium]ALV22764.1 Carboxylesterase [Carnobacterium sp. CP1]QQP70659.1 alpha/beta fold hydrolase [Carnobacterium sp. CS13]